MKITIRKNAQSTLNGPGSSHLASLPPEILGNVAAQVEKSAHVSNLSMTCRQIRSVTQPILYRELTLAIPEKWSSVVFLERLLVLSPSASGLQFTRGISVFSRNARLDGRSSQGDDSDDSSSDDDDGLDLNDMGGQRDSWGQKEFQPKVLNTIVRLIIQKIPKNQLRSFYWRHTTRLSRLTLDVLAENHGTALRDLRVWNAAEGSIESNLIFENLEVVHIGDINPNFECGWAAHILARNRRSLTHLLLGRESDLVEPMLIPTTSLEGDELAEFTPHLDDGIRDALHQTMNKDTRFDKHSKSHTAILRPVFIHFIGFDFNYLRKHGNLSLLDVGSLTSLKLESCYCARGNSQLLSLTKNSKSNSQWQPKLKSFAIRHEESDGDFQKQLEVFLSSFSGLVHLSVLLTGDGPFLSPKCFIPTHGATLQTLVWDHKTKPRTLAHSCTHTGEEGDLISMRDDISSGCPELRELGLVMSVVGHAESGFSYDDVEYLAGLTHLRTLNIRNMPELEDCDYGKAALVQEYERLANDVTKDFLNGYEGGGTHPLRTIAFGATMQCDRWRDRSNWEDEDISMTDFWLCTRIFHIENLVNIRGVRQPLLTLIGQGTATEAAEYTSDVRIFDHYWLE